MSSLLQNIAGMADMTEQVIATDLLLATKSSVWCYAAAISETATPEVREILRRHLDTEIRNHGKIAEYMTQKGYYHTKDFGEQIHEDLKVADTALNLGSGL